MPWWAFTRASGEAGGDGGGLLANMGLIRVGDHLKGPMTVLLVLVSHGRGCEVGRKRAQAVRHRQANGGGCGDEKAVMTGDMRSSCS